MDFAPSSAYDPVGIAPLEEGMKRVKFLCGLLAFLATGAFAVAGDSVFWGGLPAGPFTAGFKLIETSDPSRSFPSPAGEGLSPRPLRVYVWYPASRAAGETMRFDDYVKMALADFRTSLLPVPLARGFKAAELEELRRQPAGAVREAAPASGRFPLIVFGQGLFFESPLSNFVLCELLAAHGYVVATCPLLGTRYRLVNLNVEDIETETRDMEQVLAEAAGLPFVDPARVGLVGYDLGGMAGLLMAMRHPEVAAFLSLDSGILDKHYTGLPATHPQYREDRFRTAWMHMTQARFIRSKADRSKTPSLFERKAFGPSYLVHVPTTVHGDFSSYAALGIKAEVPGYWDAPASDPKPVYERICRLSLAFFGSALQNDGAGLKSLVAAGTDPAPGAAALRIEAKEASAGPPSEAELVSLLIEKGIGEARPVIERARAALAGRPPIDESVLNWLGLHFLYWWGREGEAVAVFELNAAIHPDSWSAYNDLGGVYEELGRKDEAIKSYKRSLEIKPENDRAKAGLERLSPVKKEPAST